MCLVKTEGATADNFSTLESKLSLLLTLIAGSCTDIHGYINTSLPKTYFLCLLAKEQENEDMLSDKVCSLELLLSRI